MRADPASGQGCAGCAALQARVIELELRYMDLEQQLEELAAVVHRQSDQLAALERELQAGLAGGDDDSGMTEFM